ncbi:MAG: bestrophin family ion channel [Planctomycetota bacterium]
MHTGRRYTLSEIIFWTRYETGVFLLVAAVPVVLYELFAWRWLVIPWLPIALLGTAVAFLVGFKNNASYDRQWEARKIWGGIVNASRSWGMYVNDYITDEHSPGPLDDRTLSDVKRTLIYRHLAWLTALRHQLRTPREWENHGVRSDAEYRRHYPTPEREVTLEQELRPLLSAEDYEYVIAKQNRATHLLSLQSRSLKDLKLRGLIEDFRHIAMENLLVEMVTQQGKCERIKNFPYPRQYATLNRYFVWLFVLLVPIGMMPEFEKLGEGFVWLTIPFSALVAWVFHTMERIGDVSENPFEGSPNDIPITALARTIEIDLRQMLDEPQTPPPLEPVRKILM